MTEQNSKTKLKCLEGKKPPFIFLQSHVEPINIAQGKGPLKMAFDPQKGNKEERGPQK